MPMPMPMLLPSVSLCGRHCGVTNRDVACQAGAMLPGFRCKKQTSSISSAIRMSISTDERGSEDGGMGVEAMTEMGTLMQAKSIHHYDTLRDTSY